MQSITQGLIKSTLDLRESGWVWVGVFGVLKKQIKTKKLKGVHFVKIRKNKKMSYSISHDLISHDSNAATSIEASCFKLTEDNRMTLLNLQNQMLQRVNKYLCCVILRTFTKKKHLQNSSTYEKYEYGHLGRWYIKSTHQKRFLYWKKIFKKKMVTGKALFFVILSICHNIGLKCCRFNHSTFN